MSDPSQKPHGRQHITLPCPSPSPGAYSNSWPLSRWCHSTISSFAVLFSSCPKSFPVSGSFLMNQPFTSGGQSIGASASVLPVDIQGWFSLGLTGLISLQSKELSRVFSNTTIQKHQLFSAQPSLWSNFSSVQLLSHVWLVMTTPWTAARQATVSTSNSLNLLKLMSIELVMPSNHLILCQPLLLLPSIFPSIKVFSNESVLPISGQSIGVSASASVLPMNIQDWVPLGWTGWISL